MPYQPQPASVIVSVIVSRDGVKVDQTVKATPAEASAETSAEAPAEDEKTEKAD